MQPKDPRAAAVAELMKEGYNDFDGLNKLYDRTGGDMVKMRKGAKRLLKLTAPVLNT